MWYNPVDKKGDDKMSKKSLICRLLFLRFLVVWPMIGVAACGMVYQAREPESARHLEQPNWITELIYKQDVIETVGYSSQMDLTELSLKRADSRAVKEMANILASVVKSSITDLVRADGTLDDAVIQIIHEEVTELYANADISGIAIVDHHKDAQTGLTYSLARLRREDAVKDASMKAEIAVSVSVSLFDKLAVNAAIRSRLISTGGGFMEAIGYASLFTEEPEEGEFGSYEVAMRRAELNARAALARETRIKITNDVQEWLRASKDNLGDSSNEIFLEDIANAFAEVKLEGSRIMRRHFRDDTKTAYAQAVMDKTWIAKEFSNAATPVLNRSGKTELEEELDQIIHNSLDILTDDPAQEGVPEKPEQQESQSSTEKTRLHTRESFDDWEWWDELAKEGSREECFYGIGSGRSQGKADEEALGRLSGYIGVHVTTRVSEQLRATAQDVQLWYEESVDIESNRDLYGVTYRHYNEGALYYSLAYVSRQRVNDTVEAVCRCRFAWEALNEGDFSEALKQTLHAAEVLESLDNKGFPIYIKPGQLLEVELGSLMDEALDGIIIDDITEIHPSGTEHYGVQIYTNDGRNLRHERIVFRFVDSTGNTYTIYGYTDANGRCSIEWSESNGSTLEAVPQFILDIESRRAGINLDSATGRFRRHWGHRKDRLAEDTHEVENLWGRIQERMQRNTIRMDGRKLRVRIWMDSEDGIYKQNEGPEIYFRSNQDCCLVLCNITVDGKVRLIFPNDYQTDNSIKGGKVYRIPDETLGHRFRFYINPPFGKERIYAFASTWPLDEFVEEIREQNGQVGSVKDMVETLEKNSSKSIAEAKGIGVAPLEISSDSGNPLRFAHDWCILTSVGGE